MAQIFSPAFDLKLKLVILCLIAAAVAAVIVWRMASGEPNAIYAAVDQTIPFSHKHHVGDDGIDCRFCHASVETSAFAGIPSSETCLNCHSQLFTDAQALAPLMASWLQQKPLRWRRVHQLPDFVYFNHGIHVNKGIGCETCHGRIDQMPLTRRVESLEMRWCLDCHRAPERHLRPRDKVFDMGWQPPQEQTAAGRKLAEAYGIRLGHLTDCSLCHR